ncbi:MAG: hypothetical protein BWX98_01635 [Candidatus Aminicenantes bacterium ADurb.Bin147]|nr:MAG: hypothetical protein BWX98_01635 [Candidatus Aminicenantes bacterium ADurb.Bin147]
MVRMSDGSYRVALYKNKRTWTLTWDNLTDAQLAILESVHAYNTALRFQNGWVSAAWYNVVIADYRTNLNADSLHRPVKRYSATIQLREF